VNVRPPPGDRKPAPQTVSLAEASTPRHEYRTIRALIWLYFWLLIFEGALRKWIFPQYASPLLIMRDPVVLVIYLFALIGGIFPRNGLIIWASILFVASGIASFFTEQHNLLVTLYGLRTNFVHLPLIFIIPRVFTLKDVEKLGKWLLIVSVPMAILVFLQFRSSPGAWVNVGVGGSEGGQMEVGFGKIRPPGTFSFTSGMAAYLGLVAAMLMSWVLKRSSISRAVVLAAVPAAGVMIGVSGSRTVLTSIVIIFLGVGYVCWKNPSFRSGGVRAAFMIALAFCMLQLVREFRQGMMVHQSRLTTGGGLRQGLVYRVLGGFIEPFTNLDEVPWLGNGIGLGTTVAGGLLYGERTFILAENEWLRIVKESGPILGFLYLALRVAIVISMGLSARRALDHENPTPMLLFCATFPAVLNGQFGVTTILGFATFSAGLCFASTRVSAAETSSSPAVAPQALPNTTRTVRGRSIYAEKLHGG
jgi:hypothetical protein